MATDVALRGVNEAGEGALTRLNTQARDLVD
jgi:hypothetical protein